MTCIATTNLSSRIARNVAAIALASIALNACGDQKSATTAAKNPTPAPKIVAFDNPADSGSAQPGITLSPNGSLYLSWQQRMPDSTLVLRYAIRSSDKWSDVRNVQTDKRMMASAGDVPSIHETPAGVLVAVWRGMHAAKGYDIFTAHSADSGKTWSAPVMPHRDNTEMEHGFVSWLQLGDTSAMIWVDGRGNVDPDKRNAQRNSHSQNSTRTVPHLSKHLLIQRSAIAAIHHPSQFPVALLSSIAIARKEKFATSTRCAYQMENG